MKITTVEIGEVEGRKVAKILVMDAHSFDVDIIYEILGDGIG